MLSVDEILNLVAGGESYNVDFKRSVPSKVRELTEKVCSFSVYKIVKSLKEKGILMHRGRRSDGQWSVNM